MALNKIICVIRESKFSQKSLIKSFIIEAGTVAQVVECLPSDKEAKPCTAKKIPFLQSLDIVGTQLSFLKAKMNTLGPSNSLLWMSSDHI
jgi:hypothetical protein